MRGLAMTVISLLLCLLGLWISIYFTGVSYHRFPVNVKWVPQICQLKEKSCGLIIHTPRAKLFGIPNSVYGIALYLYLILFFLGLPLAWWLGFLGAVLATLRSVYLAYSLIFVTKVPCPLCFTTHLINLILSIYLWTIR